MSDGAPEAASTENELGDTFRRRVRRFFARDSGLSARIEKTVSFAGFRNGQCRLTTVAHALALGGRCLHLPAFSIPADDADASANPDPLVCRTGTPGAPFGA